MLWKYSSKWELYIADENGGFIKQDSGDLPRDHYTTFITAPNGYGRSEIIFHICSGSNKKYNHSFERWLVVPGDTTLSKVNTSIAAFTSDYADVGVISANFTGCEDEWGPYHYGIE